MADRKYTRRKYRQEVIHESARRRDTKYENIMNAHDNDTSLFYKLIRDQSSVRDAESDEIIVNGTSCKGHKDMCKGSRIHFQDLATPDDNDIGMTQTLMYLCRKI